MGDKHIWCVWGSGRLVAAFTDETELREWCVLMKDARRFNEVFRVVDGDSRSDPKMVGYVVGFAEESESAVLKMRQVSEAKRAKGK